MVTINLQWLAVPFFLWSAYQSVLFVLAGCSTRYKADIMPLIGGLAMIKSLIHVIIALSIGCLIILAFR